MGHLINPISFRLGYSRNWGFSGALMESKSQYFYLNNIYWNIFLFFKRVFSLQIFEKMGILLSHMRYVYSFNNQVVILYLYDGPLQNESFIFYKYLNFQKKISKLVKFNKFFFHRFIQKAFYSFYFLKTLSCIIDILLSNLINILKKRLYLYIKKFIFYKINFDLNLDLNLNQSVIFFNFRSFINSQFKFFFSNFLVMILLNSNIENFSLKSKVIFKKNLEFFKYNLLVLKKKEKN